MEDVLEVYKRPYDSRRPVVCLDETGRQLIGEVRTPVPAAPGQVAHYDCEYVRNGVANLFMMFEPAQAKRLTERFEFHYTPKHGSWLDMAEIELASWAGNACRGGSTMLRNCAGKQEPGRNATTKPTPE